MANKVDDAHRAVLAAKSKVSEAETALSEALDARDSALADAGWSRVAGVFNPGVRLYGSALYPTATLSGEEAVEVVAQQRKAAA